MILDYSHLINKSIILNFILQLICTVTLFQCFLTTTIGLASSFCNGMIVLTIANQKIRCSKELLIVVALAFTDSIEGKRCAS